MPTLNFPIRLLYLTETNLRDRLFIKDMVHNFTYPLEEKVLLLHAPFGGTVRDTRFVTKRLSTLLSETMVYNNAFAAEQRGLFVPQADGYGVHVKLIEQLLAPINLLIVGPVVAGSAGPELADPLALVAAARRALPIQETIVFTDHPLSPLGQKKVLIEEQAQIEELAQVYDEEVEALRLAHRLRPALLASPANYAQL